MVSGNLLPLTVEIPKRTESQGGADSLLSKNNKIKNVDTPDAIFCPKGQFKFGPSKKKV